MAVYLSESVGLFQTLGGTVPAPAVLLGFIAWLVLLSKPQISSHLRLVPTFLFQVQHHTHRCVRQRVECQAVGEAGAVRGGGSTEQGGRDTLTHKHKNELWCSSQMSRRHFLLCGGQSWMLVCSERAHTADGLPHKQPITDCFVTLNFKNEYFIFFLQTLKAHPSVKR